MDGSFEIDCKMYVTIPKKKPFHQQFHAGVPAHRPGHATSVPLSHHVTLDRVGGLPPVTLGDSVTSKPFGSVTPVEIFWDQENRIILLAGWQVASSWHSSEPWDEHMSRS